jgi:3-phytase
MKNYYLLSLFISITLSSCAHQSSVNTTFTLVKSTHLSLELAPIIGTTASGQQIRLGGFSGLVFKEEKDGELVFQTHTDRGPTGQIVDKDRTFLLPDFSPEIVTIKTHLKDNIFEISDELKLKKKTGLPLTGLPNHRAEENPVDINGMSTSIDKDGLNTEGLTYDGEGGYWMSDDYGPSLVHFDVEGKMLRRLTPGNELPKIYMERLPNFGFEGLAKTENKIFGILRSSLPHEDGVARIVEVSLDSLHTNAEYFYPFEKGSKKIGDMAAISDNTFLILEDKKIFKIQLITPEQNVSKIFLYDLANTAFKDKDKIAGITLIDRHRIGVISDNHFQVTGKTNFSTGITQMNQAKNELLILEFNQELK